MFGLGGMAAGYNSLNKIVFSSVQWPAAIPSAMAGHHPHAHLLQAVRDMARRDMVLEWQSWVRIQHPALTDHHWSQFSVANPDDESLVQTQHAKPSMNNQADPADDAFDPTVYDAPPAKRRKQDDDRSTTHAAEDLCERVDAIIEGYESELRVSLSDRVPFFPT